MDQSGIQLYTADGKARNLPVPSADPNDPLNMSSHRQRVLLAALCVFAITGFGVVQTTPLFFGNLIQEYMVQSRGTFNPARIIDLASYTSLCMGMGNFFFVPLSMAVGRRTTLLLCNVLLLASIIWAAKSTSFSSHLGARCLQGLTAGVADCLLPIMALDVSFLHLRSKRLVFYWVATAAGPSLLLIPIPFIISNANDNWRVAYYFWTGFAGMSLVLVFCFVPETLFSRQGVQISGEVQVSDSYGTYRTFASSKDARAAGFDVAEADHQAEATRNAADKPSFLGRLAPMPIPKSAFKKFLMTYADMATCLLSPGVIWALLFNSFVFAGIVVLSLTYAQQLEQPPWHFSPSTVGTVQAGAAIGAVLGLCIGEVAEPLSRFFTRRNGGKREPEHVLPNFLFPSVMAALGLVLYGVIAAHPSRYHWIGVHIAFGIFSFGFCALSAISGVWLGELLPHKSGPAIVLVCGGRNALSFAYSHYFNSWQGSIGFMEVYVMFGSVLLGLGLLSIPLFFLNKQIRKLMSGVKWLG
ncbi:unnamed protein product [Fusarium langsethiae]|nr:unnamed protein product [Fusarium langsethiae]